MMTNQTDNHVDPMESSVDKSYSAITVKIESFKKFATKRDDGYNYLYSDTVWLQGLPWQLRVDCDCRKGADNSFVDVFLFCKAENVADNFDCLVRATFTIVSASAEKSKDVSYRLKEHFVVKQMAWGCTNLKRVSDLIKQENGFLLHGALYINVSIIAEKPFAQKSKSSGVDSNATIAICALDDKFTAQLKAMDEKFDGLSLRLNSERENRLLASRTANTEMQSLSYNLQSLRNKSCFTDSELKKLTGEITLSQECNNSIAERLTALESRFESLLASVVEYKERKEDQSTDMINDAASELQDGNNTSFTEPINKDSAPIVAIETKFECDLFKQPTQSDDEESFCSEDDICSSFSKSSSDAATSEDFEKLDENDDDHFYSN